jgi:phenylpyruvate tautomerase PptA (4-oxalocrotonate tautomerase family)
MSDPMPSTTVEVVRNYSADEESAIVEAVHAALVEALRIPEADRTVRLIVHRPHRFAIPPDQTDRYTLISVDLFEGRSMDAKRQLYRALVTNLGRLGIPGDHVKVLLREIPPQNWGIRGGQPASEVDLGFRVDV